MHNSKRIAVTKQQLTTGHQLIQSWLQSKGYTPFGFQEKTWDAYAKGYSGMLVAPTGFGKTYAVFIGLILDFLNKPQQYTNGLKMIWITPLRSLAKVLAKAMQEAIDEIGLDWTVETRNGDTDKKIKERQSKQMPDILLVTPESLHLLIAQKGRNVYFKNLQAIVADEWHELLSSKRGVMVELAIAFLVQHIPTIRIWGITATIGNLSNAMDVLIPYPKKKKQIIAKEKKKIAVNAVYPEAATDLPWAGHLGSSMVQQVIPIILQSKSTLIFTNTRSQSEYWYQLLLDAYPDFAGQIALHHSSIDAHIRTWIEDALSAGKLKAVVATSSLDLGVDFKPVDTVIQIGSSKGVARFLQRAGRSGHAPDETSHIYFVPTHLLELLEVAALKTAIKTNTLETRESLIMCFDVLVQFLITMALGGGFKADEAYAMIKSTYAYQWINEEEWLWCLAFITVGGNIGQQYEEFHKVTKNEADVYLVTNRKVAALHRMNLGVIVSDAMIKVKFVSGGYIGMLEEYFVAKLKPGEKFILAGRTLAFIRMKDMTAYVRLAKGQALTPSWMGGKLPLSANLGAFVRAKLAAANMQLKEEELKFLAPLINKQLSNSHIPAIHEFLVENIHTKEGYHLFMYPFEGRLVHEVMAALMAYRISRLYPISFSMAMNDYGFELFSDKPINLHLEELQLILSKENLMQDVIASINAAEMAKRKFRDIAVIAGYVVQQYYNKQRNNKSLQASAGTIFNVLEAYDPHNLLLKQAYNEVFNQQLQADRLQQAFDRIQNAHIVYTQPANFSPLSFPIKVDSLRQSLSSEDLVKRIQQLQASKKTSN